ncbi:MAG: MFS transporter [Myxococcales bacterium]|nr:MFS transporter [Myxococcales bacterium]
MTLSQPAPGARPQPADAERLPLTTVIVYGLPTLGMGCMVLILMLFFLKYTTDVLLIAPASMGLIFGLSRIWDAISDPLVGYWSDRTRSRWGRRRPWMLLSSLPIALLFLMLWSPPAQLEGFGLTLWIAVAVFGFFTATTIFFIPHQALGAELSNQHHDRTRIFGVRHLFFGIGTLAAVLGIALLNQAPDPRATALRLAAPVSLVTAALIIAAVSQLRERPENWGRGATSPFAAAADVWANPHARRLLFVFLISSLGGASLAVLAPFVVEYVLEAPGLLPYFFGFYFVPAYLLVPVWLPLSRRFGKKNLWLFAMVVSALGYGSLSLLGPGDGAWMSALAVVIGIGGGCGQMLGPSVQADVIDYDELRTGQRKEGAYFAAWSFTFKAASGLGFMLAGLMLELSGFEPNAVQNETTKLALRMLFGLFPCVCYLIGALAFSRFRLTESEHSRIRLALDRRDVEE